MINGIVLRDALISGANNMARQKDLVNQLNIFPVPDGDTGTNMSMTMQAAVRQLVKEPARKAGDVIQTAASAMLLGARGNSGVILSLLFRGLSQGLEGLEEVSGRELIGALQLGVEAAYQSVSKPTEGTILTVARVACEKGRAACAIDENPVLVWDAVCRGAADALEATPELLHVLKRAGVVDAGGKGLCLIFEGMMSVFESGEIIPAEPLPADAALNPIPTDDFFRNAAAEFDEDITFTYCTELIIGRELSGAPDPLDLRAFLETIGDCVVVVDDPDVIKVHVHTETPGKVLEESLRHGQLLHVKVENMKEQHRLAGKPLQSDPARKAVPPAPVQPTEEVGFVAVCSGDGLQSLFSDLGCSQVVCGGQTMNPSTDDLLHAVLATPAKHVFVLPNNKNILMAAEQTAAMAEDREVIVLPTKTIPQGLSAMLAYADNKPPSENTLAMMEAASHVRTGLVTFAARDSEFGGHKMRAGDILALEDGKLTFVDKDPVHAVVKLGRSMLTRSTSFVTLIYGEEISEMQAEDACNRIRNKAGNNVEVTLINGGQPIYSFILSVE